VPVLLLLPSDPSATSLPHRTPPTIVLRSSRRRRRPMFDVVDNIFAVEALDGPYADVESLVLVAVAVVVVVEALLVDVVAVVIDVAVVFDGLRVVFREVHLHDDDRRRRHRSMIPSSYQQLA
jgi:hypothetical protein